MKLKSGKMKLAVGLMALGFALAWGGRARAAGLLVADGGFGGELEIVEQDVRVTINNGIAVTEIDQTFRNLEKRQVEALYTFPVPKGASVANFSMWIGGKEMIGEVVEKERARKIYESYKEKRRDPGLLEQVDYKTFEMRIFPIAPGAEQRIRLSYYQELDFDNDWATYVYPLATESSRGGRQRTTGRFSLSLDVKSEIPIVAMESPSHGGEFAIIKHTEEYYQASLETREGDLSRDVVLAYHVERPHTGIDILTFKEGRDDGYFSLTMTAGDELSGAGQGMDYVFVLDISGSMEHDGKLRISSEQIAEFVNTLGEDDRFEIIAFNVQPVTLFNQLTAVDEQTQAEALAFLTRQRARGGTSLRPALTTAYRYGDPDRTLNVVVLSDGMTGQSESRDILSMVQNRPSASRVFCIGVGNEVNRPMLRRLAEEAGGLASFISRGDDFERQARAFRRKLMKPVATNLEITFEGRDVYDVEPRTLPNLYHGMPVRLYGRYRKDGPTTVRVRAEIGGELLDITTEIDLPRQNDENPEIERMWAWRRVQRLLHGEDGKGTPSRGDIKEIVRLGEAYSIATQHTSFIVLENDAEYKRWKIDRENALKIKRDRRSRKRVRNELEGLRTKALAQLGPGADEDERLQAAADKARRATPEPRRISRARNAPARNAPAQPTARERRRRGFHIDVPSGGGALDPVTALMGLGIAALGGASVRRKRKR